MKNRIIYLIYAVLFNAIGTALMAKSNLGMSAWGAASINLAEFLNVSLGVSFNIIAVVFYLIALILLKGITLKEVIYSFAFAFSFGTFTDLFVYLLPNISAMSLFVRVVANIIGLLIMCLGIAIHLRINVAVHPMDVYLGAVQRGLKNVAIGTYVAYGSAFLVGVAFGVMNGGIVGIGFGTAFTLLFGGLILGRLDKVLKIKVEG